LHRIDIVDDNLHPPRAELLLEFETDGDCVGDFTLEFGNKTDS
jgi:hypothetical protein